MVFLIIITPEARMILLVLLCVGEGKRLILLIFIYLLFLAAMRK